MIMIVTSGHRRDGDSPGAADGLEVVNASKRDREHDRGRLCIYCGWLRLL
jgi:hypothetical protein